MKKKILLSVVFGCLTAFSETVYLSEGVAVRLRVPEPKLTVFVSYPGKIGNQCGVKLLWVKLLQFDSLGNHDVGEIVNNLDLQIDSEPLNGMISGHRSVKYSFPKELLEQSLYGAFLSIETKHGRNLSEVITAGERELILVSTPCRL